MVFYSVNKEIEGYLDMEYESKQGSFDSGKARQCKQQWGFQYNMVASCYKR